MGLRLSSGKGLSGLLIVPLEASRARRGVSVTFGGVGFWGGAVFGGSLAQSAAGSPVYGSSEESLTAVPQRC